MITRDCRIPTREDLKNTIANIENGKFGFAFSQRYGGNINHTFPFFHRSHIIVSDDLYGGTYRLFEEIYKKSVWNFPILIPEEQEIEML
jgi:cystathionine gamma-synthase